MMKYKKTIMITFWLNIIEKHISITTFVSVKPINDLVVSRWIVTPKLINELTLKNICAWKIYSQNLMDKIISFHINDENQI